MEPLSTWRLIGGLRSLVLGLSVVMIGGCLPVEKQPAGTPTTPIQAPPEFDVPDQSKLPACNLRLEAGWNNTVLMLGNSVEGGKQVPALSVRIWLFGPDTGLPVLREGKLLIKMFDMTGDLAQNPKWIEGWEIDATTLRGLARPDIIGPGYSIVVPWNTYNAGVQRVNMQTIFVPTDAKAFMKQSGMLSIDHANVNDAAKKLGKPTLAISAFKNP